MEFRNATLADIDRILEIIKQAKSICVMQELTNGKMITLTEIF